MKISHVVLFSQVFRANFAYLPTICLNAHILVTNSTKCSWKWLKASTNEYLDSYFSFPTRCCKGASSWGYTCLKMLGVPLFFLWRWEYVTLKNGLTLEMHLKMKEGFTSRWVKTVIGNEDLGFLLLFKPNEIMMVGQNKIN